ncbi:VanZ family protein [Crossiella sp. NPDC003009]
MTATYLGSIRAGLLLFLGAGLVLMLPVAAVHYRRYGRLDARRALVLYAFLAYAAVALALVFLPLPDPMKVCATVQDTTQLRPFQFLVDTQSELAKHGRSGFLAGLTSKSVLSFVFNIALFAPLGVFLRRAFGKDLRTTVTTGFAVSLFIELTQLTGNWGTFPCSYRLFDVDDLLGNTTGALLGFAIAPLVLLVPRLLPTPALPLAPVSVPRKLAALGVDLLLSGMFFLTTGGTLFAAVIPVLMARVFVPWLAQGWTPGGWLLGYRAHREDGSWRGLLRLAGREAGTLPGLGCFVLIAPVLADGLAGDLRVLLALGMLAGLGLVLAFRSAEVPATRRERAVPVQRRPVTPIEHPEADRRLTPTG